MKCKNPYCPIDFKQDKELCLSCEHMAKEEFDKYDLPDGFADIFNKGVGK